MSVAFGKNFGDLESDSDVYRYLSMTESFMPVVPIVLVYPWLCNVLESKFLKMMAPKDTDKQGMGKVMGQVASFLSTSRSTQRRKRKFS
jgi:hypothetical protein